MAASKTAATSRRIANFGIAMAQDRQNLAIKASDKPMKEKPTPMKAGCPL
jgi:hypothetical protein